MTPTDAPIIVYWPGSQVGEVWTPRDTTPAEERPPSLIDAIQTPCLCTKAARRQP